jgi:hypothetical protein
MGTIAELCADYVLARAEGKDVAWLARADLLTLPCNERAVRVGADPQTHSGKPFPKWMKALRDECKANLHKVYAGRFPDSAMNGPVRTLSLQNFNNDYPLICISKCEQVSTTVPCFATS